MPMPLDAELPAALPVDQVSYDHALASATTVVKQFTIQRAARVLKVEYVNPTGYTQDAANYYTLEVRKGATVIASWSLQTGAQGTIAADTLVNLVLSATDANRVLAAGDRLDIALVKTAAAANLPAGRFIVHYR